MIPSYLDEKSYIYLKNVDFFYFCLNLFQESTNRTRNKRANPEEKTNGRRRRSQNGQPIQQRKFKQDMVANSPEELFGLPDKRGPNNEESILMFLQK